MDEPPDVGIDLAALEGNPELRRVRHAFWRTEQAYARARALVFDVREPGDDSPLTPEQQHALDALEEAERTLDRARRAMHGSRID
ncbi:MAG TPA: hypothetical protein VNU26_02005 [Mycobacteriales bacterium]|nr:hypothetical protein [Mycobacteriales bacterium]